MRPGRLNPSRILWPTIYTGALALVVLHVFLISLGMAP